MKSSKRPISSYLSYLIKSAEYTYLTELILVVIGDFKSAINKRVFMNKSAFSSKTIDEAGISAKIMFEFTNEWTRNPIMTI